ncbi:MAG: HD domain-containing protein [Candidatus Heimdallarchaeota archaeon]|nr:MAG: HD domain-containing protein [Candidatus Heimdallarchaeota archaeon]
MKIFENIILMKRLLRQGWIRSGVPPSSIESLADHSWSVALLSFLFCSMENQLRSSTENLDVTKAVLIGLLHDLHESEYFDIDKSVRKIVFHEQLEYFQQHLEEGATRSILTKVPAAVQDSFHSVMNDRQSEEYHLVRIADLLDLLIQAREFNKKHWLDENQYQGFKKHALEQLEQYKNQFSFLEEFLHEFTS